MADFDPVKRALNGHLTDRDYGARCEQEAASARVALEAIVAMFRPGRFVDGKAVLDAAEKGLAGGKAAWRD